MRNTKVGLIVGAIAALVGTACSKSEPKQATTEPTKEAAPQVQDAPKEENVIKLGQIMPYSGPASAYGTIGKLQSAYFEALNKKGGIDGKQVKLISMDDSYSPPRAVEQVRRLVETDHVTAVFNNVGTPSNTAVRPYLNEKKVAQLFVATGASKWADPQHFPYTIGFNPSYRVEGRTYAEHILKTKPKAKVAVLYQGDDFGKDIFEGIKEGFGEQQKKMIVAEATYESSDPTIDSQIVSLKSSKADVVVLVTTPKFGAQAIKKVSDLNWNATRYIVNVSASIGSVLVPAGLERAKGLITTMYLKDPNDKKWAEDPAMKEYFAFLKSDFPSGDVRDQSNLYGFVAAQTLVQVLKQCAGDYSAESLMKQAASLKNFAPGLLLPGIEINTSATDFELFDKMQLATFDGESWKVMEQNGVASSK